MTPDHFDAVLFDLDGVFTETAKLHPTRWKKMFEEYLPQHADEPGFEIVGEAANGLGAVP